MENGKCSEEEKRFFLTSRGHFGLGKKKVKPANFVSFFLGQFPKVDGVTITFETGCISWLILKRVCKLFMGQGEKDLNFQATLVGFFLDVTGISCSVTRYKLQENYPAERRRVFLGPQIGS